MESDAPVPGQDGQGQGPGSGRASSSVPVTRPYFLGRPSWIAGLHREREPLTDSTGAGEREVLVFGSDGGGTMYAVPVRGGRPVYLLPPGEISDGCYRHPLGTADAPPMVADALEEFLTVLVEGLERHVATGAPAPFA